MDWGRFFAIVLATFMALLCVSFIAILIVSAVKVGNVDNPNGNIIEVVDNSKNVVCYYDMITKAGSCYPFEMLDANRIRSLGQQEHSMSGKNIAPKALRKYTNAKRFYFVLKDGNRGLGTYDSMLGMFLMPMPNRELERVVYEDTLSYFRTLTKKEVRNLIENDFEVGSKKWTLVFKYPNQVP